MASMNLADPELELIDPTPNIHSLFVQFDKVFFSTKLNSRAVVRWSKRMYSCAGTCSYEGRGGLCDIALSEPLLKLRPRKDLVETLLHEMIHAFLFVTSRDQDRDGHGPNFRLHMHRINKSAGLNITIYHDFHDEVKLYLTHWWRCDGPCQKMSPYFGIVRRSSNRAPGPSDFWWKDHKRKCGGAFVKIKDPPQKVIGSKTMKKNVQDKSIKNKKSNVNKGMNSINTPTNTTESHKVHIFIDSDKKNVYNTNGTHVFDTTNVAEHVRNIWANKQIPVRIGVSNPDQNIMNNRQIPARVPENNLVRNIWASNKVLARVPANNPVRNISANNQIPNQKAANYTVKHKTNDNLSSPPVKLKTIDDYFKANATLQDLYGKKYVLPKPQCSNHPDTVNNIHEQDIIECPVCNAKISHKNINRHLDECLNKDIIKNLTNNNEQSSQLRNGETDCHISPNIKRPIDLTINNLPNNERILNEMSQANAEPIDLVNNDQNGERNETEVQLQPTDAQIANNIAAKRKSKDIIESSKNKNRKTDRFITKNRGDDVIEIEFTESQKISRIKKTEINLVEIITEPGTSKSTSMPVEESKATPGPSKSNVIPEQGIINNEIEVQTCPCCGKKFNKTVEDHLEECLAFIIDDTWTPNEKLGTSHGANHVVVIDDDDVDIFDESQTLNSTGTKTPCPCCMRMVEQSAMESHLDFCLGKWFE